MLLSFTYLLVYRGSRMCCSVLITYWYVGVLEFVTQFYLPTIIAQKIVELVIFHKCGICLCQTQIFSGSIYVGVLECVAQFYLPTGM